MLLNNQLTSLLDQHGLFSVLAALSVVCEQRANSAKLDDKDAWETAQSAIDAAASKILDVRLP